MFAVLGKLSHFFKQHWKRYSFATFALLLASAIGLLPPKLLGFIIDHIQHQTLSTQILYSVLTLFGLAMFFHYLFGYLWSIMLFTGAILLEKDLRSQLMEHYLNMTPSFYDKHRTGDLMARATNDLKAVANTAGFGILTLVDSTTYMLMIIAMMGFTISWKLTLLALLPLPLMAVIMNKYGALIHARFTTAQSAFADINNSVLESIRGVRALRAYVQEESQVEDFSNLTEDVYKKNMEVTKIDALFEPTMQLLVGLSYVIGLGYGAILVFESQLSLGDLVTFNVYLGMLIWPMFAVGELINILQRGNASLDRVNHTLSYEPDVKDIDSPEYLPFVDSIEFKELAFAYPETKQNQLTQISFKIKRGETLGLVGKTGGGKTTLFKLMLREYEYKTGQILFSGINLKNIASENVQELIGYVPQDQVLFSKTIRENIQFGKPDASDEEIYDSLEKAHFLNDLLELPEGLDTLVGESGVTLSGGQQQRVALARAFIKDPDILILDDSLSAVDGDTEANIIEHIRSERKDKTTLISAHRLSAVTHADHILVIEDGFIIEAGNHAQLMETKGWYYQQFMQQQLNDEEVISHE